MPIREFLFVLLCLISGGVMAESYELLQKSESGGLYYVRGSLANSGKGSEMYPALNILINNKNGFTTPNGRALSMMQFLIVNCEKKLQITNDTLFYSGYFSEGERLYANHEIFNQKIFKSIERKFCPK